MPLDQWKNRENLPAKRFVCGHCSIHVGSDQGYRHQDRPYEIHLCPVCERPTFFLGGDVQVPGVAYGTEVGHLPDDVAKLYREARNCMSVSSYTAAVLTCRKLLMHVAVSQGATENEKFIVYVDYLASNGYVPPNAKGWVDHIRKKGNEATHEIPLTSKADAEDLLTFIEMILKLIFEFPNRVPGHGI